MKNTINHLFRFFLIGFLLFSCTSKEKICDYQNEIIYGKEIKAFTNLEDAKACSRDSGKSILIVFDMINGSMRKSIDLLVESVKGNNLDEKYVVVFLFVDDKTPLKKDYEAKFSNGKIRKMTTVGDVNMLTQIEMFNVLATPYHVIVDQNLKTIKEPHGFFSNNEMIEEYLM